jgi:hypothetical protein
MLCNARTLPLSGCADLLQRYLGELFAGRPSGAFRTSPDAGSSLRTVRDGRGRRWWVRSATGVVFRRAWGWLAHQPGPVDADALCSVFAHQPGPVDADALCSVFAHQCCGAGVDRGHGPLGFLDPSRVSEC